MNIKLVFVQIPMEKWLHEKFQDNNWQLLVYLPAALAKKTKDRLNLDNGLPLHFGKYSFIPEYCLGSMESFSLLVLVIGCDRENT